MDDMNFGLDDTMMSSTNGLEGSSMNDDTTGMLGASHSHSSFGTDFDAEHPYPSYEELRKAGFSEYLAHRISDGGAHSYSDEELYHVIYESEDPVAAYNEMMNAKAYHAMDRADAMINDIEDGGLLRASEHKIHTDDASHYNNESASSNNPQDENELGSCDCRSECNYNTGKRYMYADYGYSD